ncbi:MAG: EamA family transporter [Saprospiraceae bacterium]|nr:EamA family transporter [Candidatus Defluviibacterium haderslevense]
MDRLSKPYLALMLTCLIWGTTYLVNKLGVTQIPVFLFTSTRQLISGGLLLMYLFIIKKHPWPDTRYLLFQGMMALFMITLGNGIGTYGLAYIDSGVSAILAAVSPVIIALLTIYLKPDEQLNRIGWLGIITGFGGVVMICFDKLAPAANHDSTVLGFIFTLISVVAWGFGSVISKTRHFEYSPLLAAGFQMFFGGIPLAIIALFVGVPNEFHVTTNMLIIWVYLIGLGSIVAFSCYIYALKHLPATLVSIQSYINPIIAIFLGVLFLREKVSFQLIIGAVLTFIGVFLVNYSQYRRRKKLVKININ